MRSIESTKCRKCAVQKKKSLGIDNRPERKLPALSTIIVKTFSIFYFQFQFPIPHFRFSNIQAECGKRGLCNMEINK